MSKIHEQFANEQLQSYAREKGLVTKEQFGYSKNSSTIAALLIKAVDEWKWAKDKGLVFDVIDHSLLLQKLKANGISGAEHAWFFSYLTNRKQFVQCNRVNSNVDSRLNWEPHISQLIERVSPKTALLNRFAGFLDTLNIPQSKTSSGRKTFQIIAGASDWNSLPTELRKRTSI